MATYSVGIARGGRRCVPCEKTDSLLRRFVVADEGDDSSREPIAGEGIGVARVCVMCGWSARW